MIRVEVEISASVTQTIDTYAKIIIQHQLNGNGFFEVLVTGSDDDYVDYFQRGRIINFYKNNVLDLKGEIEKITFTSEGLMRIQGIELGAKLYSNANTTKKSYVTSDTDAVITDLQTYTSGVSLGTINNDSFDSFRTHVNQTSLQVLGKLAGLQGKDWYFSYSGSTIYVNLVNNKGDSNVVSLNGEIDVGVVTKEEDDSKKVKKVTVLGASYGNNQVEGVAVDGWVAGDPEITIIDKSIMTDGEADERAAGELAVLKLTRYNYSFKVLDADRVFSTGDTLTLVDKRTNTDALLRVVSIKRVVTKNNEKLELEVRSTSERERADDLLKQQQINRSYSDNGLAMNQQVDDTSLSGDVSISGSAVTDNAHLSKTGSVGTGYNTTDQGYQAYGLSADMITLAHGLTPVYNGNYRFWYHAAFVNFRINIKATGVIGFISQKIWIWLQNDDTGEYWPDSTGILISDGFALKGADSHYHLTDTPTRNYSAYTGYTGPHNHGGAVADDFEHRHTYTVNYGGESNLQSSAPFDYTEQFTLWISGYIQAPRSWQNQSYRLWYQVENGNYWDTGVYKPKVYYGYHGVREPGHTHSDSISYTDTGHTHSISGTGTATIPDHTHGTLT